MGVFGLFLSGLCPYANPGWRARPANPVAAKPINFRRLKSSTLLYYFMTFIFISLLLLTDAMLCKNQLIGNLQPKMLASN
jgi:hypothetical protein